MAFWASGGAVALVVGAFVLRHRRALNPATLAALAVGGLAFFYGAKLQFRLAYYPLRDAFVVPPGELFAPGFHVPLGIALSGVLATATCLALRAPWRAVGDALAVGGAAMMPIGRIGCLINGCCTGIACGTWTRLFCLRYPPGSEPYTLQLAAGVIPPEATTSLPVHPLHIYLGLVGLALLALQLWLLRRGAPEGTNFALGFFLYPLAQLGLEHIRAGNSVRVDALMRAVLSATIAVDVAAVALWLAYRRPRGRTPALGGAGTGRGVLP